MGRGELPLGLQVEMLSGQPDVEVWKFTGEVWAGDLYLGILSKKMGVKHSAWPRVSPQ